MKDLLSHIVSEILGCDDFEVEENVNESSFSSLRILTKADNIGLIIGKGGKTINAIRNLLKVKATLMHVGFTLDVAEK